MYSMSMIWLQWARQQQREAILAVVALPREAKANEVTPSLSQAFSRQISLM